MAQNSGVSELHAYLSIQIYLERKYTKGLAEQSRKLSKEPNENPSWQKHFNTLSFFNQEIKRNGKACIYKTDENHTVIISEHSTAQVCVSNFFHHDSTSR